MGFVQTVTVVLQDYLFRLFLNLSCPFLVSFPPIPLLFFSLVILSPSFLTIFSFLFLSSLCSDAFHLS